MLVYLSDWGHLYIPPYGHMLPYICTPPHVCLPPVHPYVSPYAIMFPYIIGCGESVHPICHGVFWGHQYICQTFLCLSVNPFAPQLLKFIPVAPHHCQSLLQWTGCLWMCDMFHAVDLFFSCSVFIMSQASTSTTMTTTTPVTVVCSSM